MVDSLFSKYHPQKRLLMNVEELQEIAECGFKIGNHTYDHSALSFLSKEEQLSSIINCNTALQNIIGDSTRHLAYPNGLYNETTLTLLNISGIKYGYTIKGGCNKKNTHSYKLRRIGINTSDSLPNIVLKLVANMGF
jgi:peptidoglycan/xylan/chitin deacetylase (PgdA/CDA1 family)